jgi:hypothetical protein
MERTKESRYAFARERLAMKTSPMRPFLMANQSPNNLAALES